MKFIRYFFTPFKFTPWILTIPFFILEAVFFVLVQYKHGFALSDHILIAASLQKLIFDIMLFLAGTMLLKFLLRINIPAIIFMLFYLYMIGQDMTIYFFGNTLFEQHYLNLITWYSIKGFIGISSLLILAAFISACTVAYFLFRKYSENFRTADMLRYIIILILISVLNPTEYLIEKSESHDGKFKGNEERNAHYILRCKNDQITYISQNSIINFFNEIFLKKEKRNYTILKESGTLQKTIDEYSLSIGKQNYEIVSNNKFNKIVLLASESISLDFFSKFNKKIPFPTETSFYESEEYSRNLLTNYYTSASPTLQALTATLNSHPNYDLILSGLYGNSLASILTKAGYTTIFLRGASKYYAGENIIFQKLGFKKIIAREYFSKFPENEKYIYDWGVSDRIVLNKLVDILDKYKNKKLFIVVLGIDTHPPYGRAEYGFKDLKYPHYPESYKGFGNAAKWMHSIYNHDYDMSETLKRIKEKGLFTEDTLIISTADHASPYNNVIKKIPGIKNTNLARIPLSFLTPAQLPEFDRTKLSSQLDLAPSILHLLNIKIPQGYWGTSIFSNKKKTLSIGYNRGTIEYISDSDKKNINAGSKNKKHQEFLKLFNSIVME